jgi:hypothetical protein
MVNSAETEDSVRTLPITFETRSHKRYIYSDDTLLAPEWQLGQFFFLVVRVGDECQASDLSSMSRSFHVCRRKCFRSTEDHRALAHYMLDTNAHTPVVAGGRKVL